LEKKKRLWVRQKLTAMCKTHYGKKHKRHEKIKGHLALAQLLIYSSKIIERFVLQLLTFYPNQNYFKQSKLVILSDYLHHNI